MPGLATEWRLLTFDDVRKSSEETRENKKIVVIIKILKYYWAILIGLWRKKIVYRENIAYNWD